MQVIRGKAFTAPKAWGAIDVANMDGITTRLHWTDQPYIWHVNDGAEVFVLLSGLVDMHIREDSGERIIRLEPGDIFHAETGDEHKAVPLTPSRILVIEKEGSI